MRKPTWLLLIAGLLACGLIAAGCGDDEGDSSSSTPTTSETTVTDDTASSTEDTSTTDATAEDTTSEDTTSSSGGEVDTDAFVAECIKQADVGGTGAEDLATQACEQLGDALKQCADSPDADVESCQKAADEATKQLEQSGGG